MKKLRPKIYMETVGVINDPEPYDPANPHIKNVFKLKEVRQERRLPSALWGTDDGRFEIYRLEVFNVWSIMAHEGSDVDLLKRCGLWDSFFKTRRDALENLEMALEGVAS